MDDHQPGSPCAFCRLIVDNLFEQRQQLLVIEERAQHREVKRPQPGEGREVGMLEQAWRFPLLALHPREQLQSQLLSLGELEAEGCRPRRRGASNGLLEVPVIRQRPCPWAGGRTEHAPARQAPT